jgi:hypothetical protein
MHKEKPMWWRIHFEEVYTDIVRIVGYAGLTYRDFAAKLQPLIQKYSQKAESAAYHLVTFEGQFRADPPPLAHVQLRADVRKLCVQILGLPPEHPWYELVEKPEPLPSMWERHEVKEEPNPQEKPTTVEEPKQEGRSKDKAKKARKPKPAEVPQSEEPTKPKNRTKRE